MNEEGGRGEKERLGKFREDGGRRERERRGRGEGECMLEINKYNRPPNTADLRTDEKAAVLENGGKGRRIYNQEKTLYLVLKNQRGYLGEAVHGGSIGGGDCIRNFQQSGYQLLMLSLSEQARCEKLRSEEQVKEDKRRVYLEQQKEERRRERLEDVRQGQLRLEQQRYGTITKTLRI